MEKKIKQEVIYFNFDNWKWNAISIEEIENDLKVLKELGATNIEFDSEIKYGDLEFTIKAVKFREETNEEYNERIKAIQEREDRIKKQELQQLEILKRKYNQ